MNPEEEYQKDLQWVLSKLKRFSLENSPGKVFTYWFGNEIGRDIPSKQTEKNLNSMKTSKLLN